ncbi:MAG: diphosphomevalonate decarboxylase [Marinovum sp.]|nr:diphosphomevalonate decarboxylase [Marinovum sp.]
MTNATAIFDASVPRPLGAPHVAEAYAPANIALSKYWGKRDTALNLPTNSSLSISLGQLGTHTKVAPADTDHLSFNGRAMGGDATAAAKIWRFVDRFCGVNRPNLLIETTNTVPTAAGLASSASGFAALVSALNDAFAADLPKETQSMLARFGSGSATRSLWPGFVRWNVGERRDGTDSHARPIDANLPDFRIAVVLVDSGPKAQSSSEGMTHTVKTSPLYATWPTQAEADCDAIEALVRDGDFGSVGALAEANALAMHASMLAARPAVCYIKPASLAHLEALWAARRDGLEAYATMDAGPNVKLMFEEKSRDDIIALFPTAQIINPFA